MTPRPTPENQTPTSTSTMRLANEAWEALFRAQVLLMRRFATDDVWVEVTQVEYDVLYTLSKSSRAMSMVEVNHGVLMTQGGVSKLMARLVDRGLVERCVDSHDRRASRLSLTAAGRDLQRLVGRRHARAVADAMGIALDVRQMEQVRELGSLIISAAGSWPERPASTKGRTMHDSR